MRTLSWAVLSSLCLGCMDSTPEIPTTARFSIPSWDFETPLHLAKTCADAGIVKIRLGLQAMNYDFPCTDGHGLSPAVPIATYLVSIDALLKDDQIESRQVIKSYSNAGTTDGIYVLPPAHFMLPTF